MEAAVFYHNLSQEFEFAKDGGFTKTATIELQAPSMECFQEAADFQQLVARAFMSAAKNTVGAEPTDQEHDGSETPNASEINVILNASADVKFSDIAEAFKTLACKVGTFDGVTKLKRDHFKKFDISDFVKMICGYVENFIFPSLFAGQ